MNDHSVAPLRLSARSRSRGMVLVVVLGLLVVLSLIGIAFGFLIRNEYQASKVALDRFRALSAAKDGEAYAIARLRMYPLEQHYEGEGDWSFMTSVTNGRRTNPQGGEESHEAYLRRYARDPRMRGWVRDATDGRNMRVSFAKSGITNERGQADQNWVDLNGDGSDQGAQEREIGRDLLESDTAPFNRISYFVGEGIDLRQDLAMQSGGTYRALGDRARLKIIDTNSQLNINDYQGDQLRYMLQVLGREIMKLYDDNPLKNPFTPDVAREIVAWKERNLGVINSKAELRQFIPDETLYDFTMDLIAVRSYPLAGSGVKGTGLDYTNARNPWLKRPVDDERRAAWGNPTPRPFSDDLGSQRTGGLDGRDGRAEEDPAGGRSFRSPVNINTVNQAVLTTMIAGLEAEARFFYFPKIANLTTADTWVNGRLVANELVSTDLLRQPNLSGSPDSPAEGELSYGGGNNDAVPNLASYQVVPVGPFCYAGVVQPEWKSLNEPGINGATNPWFGDADHASVLARAIIAEREARGPFLSWMDFEYRVLIRRLEGFDDSVSENCPDLVNTQRSSPLETMPRSFAKRPAGNSAGPNSMLPDPGDLSHPATGKNDSGFHGYTNAEFEAWYWKASVDVLRANFNPNGYYNKYNPDAAFYTTVDATDLKYSTAPMAFNTCGVYEIISQGEITATGVPGAASADPTASIGEYQVARRTFRSVVEVYRMLEHTTQRDFLRNIAPTAFADDGTAPPSQRTVDSIAHFTRDGTRAYPYSVDMSSYNYSQELEQDNTTGRSERVRGLKKGNNPEPNAIATDGYFGIETANDNVGWVTLYPQDRTPVSVTRQNEAGLNVRAFYNTSLQLSRLSTASDGGATVGNNTMNDEGVLPDSLKDLNGNDRFLNFFGSSASPDPYTMLDRDSRDLGYTGREKMSEYSNQQAAHTATLRPDGVLLRGWHLNPAFRRGGGFADFDFFSKRGVARANRLAILRYRAGSREIGTRLAPIGGQNPAQPQETLPGNTFEDPPHAVAVRLFGQAAVASGGLAQGTDTQNQALQNVRQATTNFPYYQGWIDMWIKWELPPQGKRDKVVVGGDVDPTSGNFSGLLGATSFGRCAPTRSDQTPRVAYEALSVDTDFEGSQFFVFKEPDGILRISHVYFTEAYHTTDWQASGSLVTTFPRGYQRVGNRARIYGEGELGTGSGAPGGGDSVIQHDNFTATNDIAANALDLGFSYARTDSVFDLSELNPNDKIILTPHNWYRLTISYLSNARIGGTHSREPHELFIDGKKVENRTGSAFIVPQISTTAPSGVNTGEVTDNVGMPAVFSPDWSTYTAETTLYIQRASTTLIEVDPDDRLTIGCIIRRGNSTILKDAKGDPVNSSPIFRFDTNLVAPANATLDDVRIYRGLNSQFGSGGEVSESDYAQWSRYQNIQSPSTSGPMHERGKYDNAFVPIQQGVRSSFPYLVPFRVASIQWTEYRPRWDPYNCRRLDASEADMARAPQLRFSVQAFSDVSSLNGGGPVSLEHMGPEMSGPDRNATAFWAAGGLTMRSLVGARGIWLSNDVTQVDSQKVACLKYQVFFINPNVNDLRVLNVTPVLDDVRIVIMPPARRIFSEELFE